MQTAGILMGIVAFMAGLLWWAVTRADREIAAKRGKTRAPPHPSPERVGPEDLDPESLEWIRTSLDVEVRAAYLDAESTVESHLDMVRDDVGHYDLTEVQLAEFADEARASLATHQALAATWPTDTMNTRIDDAFKFLWGKGIVALQDAGYTLSDGWADVGETQEVEHPDAWGACFFHRQDVERGIDGDGLLVAFGALTTGPDHEEESLRLGQVICEVLEDHGVPTTWDGSLDSRIEIEPFEWQRRRP